ncbi:hypothetical protein E7T06_13995 [Deinococcus sp. Arct2-2]|uniref:hypothetical protein n=1 Tax=Deinococcus sp. Arct2-2 TaxID=2568653 RepID=UPI0010A4B436|nr:hypothetical protein [Deinococcus sp. Arct2-2]THF68977.1 hypothetical protein E7T06_13995 [Deinococcus sp. Arct2-2]
MPSPVHLLARLDAIASSLSEQLDALALLALGSVGREIGRLDEHSDLDFFVIVAPGATPNYLESLTWLEQAHPVTFSFPNTPDGRKILFEDGIFAEYAVFEQRELQHIPYASGRVVWQRGDTLDALAVSGNLPTPQTHSQEWHINEALTNLLVGLRREARGERLSATRFIQTYAVDYVLAPAALRWRAEPGDPDLFTPERRFEWRFPSVAARLLAMLQGDEHNRASALCTLA